MRRPAPLTRESVAALLLTGLALAVLVLALVGRGPGSSQQAVAAAPSAPPSSRPSPTVGPSQPGTPPSRPEEPAATTAGPPPLTATTPQPAATSEPGPRPVTLAFGGDTHGERQIAAAILAGGDPLGAVAPALSAADVAVVNLETAVGRTGRPTEKSYTFQAPPELFDTLRRAGVDVVSVANNHSLDHGVDGLLETLAEGRVRGVAVVGGGSDDADAYAPHVVDVRGTRIAIVGLTRVVPEPGWAAAPSHPGLASAYAVERAADAVRSAAGVADHVAVVVHWGQERADCPDEHQVRLAAALHDAGAAVVVGAHPHVWQGVVAPAEGRLTAFSLGNFLWYATGEVSGLTGVLTVELGPAGVTGWQVVPAVIGTDGGPVPTGGEAAERLLRRARTLVPGADCPVGGVPRP